LTENDQVQQNNTCGEGCICRGSATRLPQGGVPKRSPIFGFPFYLCVYPLSQNYQISHGNTLGKMTCCKVVSHDPPKGGGAQTLHIFRVPFYFAYTLYRRTTKFDVVTHVSRENRVSWGQQRHPFPGAEIDPALPNFGVLLYLCIHPLTENDQIRHGNTCRTGVFFWTSAAELSPGAWL